MNTKKREWSKHKLNRIKRKGRKIKNEVINHKIRENTQRKIKRNLRDERDFGTEKSKEEELNTLSPRSSSWKKILSLILNTEDFDSKEPNLNQLSKENLNKERSRHKSLTDHGDSNNYNKSDGLILDFEDKI